MSCLPLPSAGLAAWRTALAQRRQRALLLITGHATACRHRLLALLDGWPDVEPGQAVWLGVDSPTERLLPLPPGRAQEWLGRPLQLAVLSLWDGLSPDGLGAIGGCIVGGGVLIVLAPPRLEWEQLQDPECARHCPWPSSIADYGSRFWRHLSRSLQGEGVIELPAEGPWPDVWQQSGDPAPPGVSELALEDQHAAVAAIAQTARGRARRPLVLIADRGRGKSAALGIAAAQLLAARQLSEIIVTCAHPIALETLFHHAQRHWPGARRQGDRLTDGVGHLRFVPADQVPATAPLLLVDEAAALPLSVLQRLLRVPRVIFASTVHGYEGSGRGFDLRFTRWLDEHAPHWRRLRLEQPLRWAVDDPLERLLFRALLLDAEPAQPLAPAELPFSCQQLDRDALVNDEQRLRHLFGLLVAAHYRTSPDDLRELLDAPHFAVWGVTQGEDGPLVGAALVAREGGFPHHLATAIQNGKRRPRGHLLAQSLAFHGGWQTAAEQQGARVLRIAVHPDLRRRGLGVQLLSAIAADAAKAGCQWLGSSFALDAEVIGFWRCAGFLPVRLGTRRDAASGARALQVVRALSPAAEEWVAVASAAFWQALPLFLVDAWRDLEPDIVAALFAGHGTVFPPPDRTDEEVLRAFVAGRPLLSCLPALAGLARHLLAESPPWMNARQRDLLVLRLVQHRCDIEVAAHLQQTGKAAVQAMLATTVRHWLVARPISETGSLHSHRR